MKNTKSLFVIILIFLFNIGSAQILAKDHIRTQTDSVGYAVSPQQMEDLMSRIDSPDQTIINFDEVDGSAIKFAISPHDDYAYAAEFYKKIFSRVKAHTVILIGVFHKARFFDTDNKLVFGTYTHWQGPYGKTRISEMRDRLQDNLPDSIRAVSDSAMQLEHSLEAFIPFLQYYNRSLEIVPILIPYMKFGKMEDITDRLAQLIHNYVSGRGWKWGSDYAVIVSSDAVHYGDEGWGGKHYDRFGTDSVGYEKAVAFEHEIIDSCFRGGINPEKARLFYSYTLDEKNYKKYKWTWCGRYSIPFGILLADKLEKFSNISLTNLLALYETSISSPPIPVGNLGMGVTAPANLNHWVGYLAAGWK